MGEGWKQKDKDIEKKKGKIRQRKEEEDVEKKRKKQLKMIQNLQEEEIILIIQMKCHLCLQQMNQNLWKKKLSEEGEEKKKKFSHQHCLLTKVRLCWKR